nr:hypothetical protein [uncultured Flavobacterium sp.]
MKLELGHFVPTDEDGNVLKDPGLIPSYELEQYRKSKEKVLFEGWEKRIKDLEAFKLHLTITKIIENAIEWDLILTQNALKKIGL